jgi:hypothetical protein
MNMLLPIMLLLALAGSLHTPGEPAWRSVTIPPCLLHVVDADSVLIPALRRDLTQGFAELGAFASRPFPHPFDVYVFPSRTLLDRQWQQAWGDTAFHSECWMVAAGVADRLDILSPTAWQASACEHDPADSAATARVIIHEMVHVFHGQCNPVPDFTGLDSLAWFIEGVATFASGQLDSTNVHRVQQAFAAGKGPQKLRDVWKGPLRYANAGSLVGYIDRRYGRSRLMELLGLTDQRAMLRLLETTEQQLLADWRESLT